MELALKVVHDLGQAASSLMGEGDLGEVCPWRKKIWLLEEVVAHRRALVNIEQPWKKERVKSSHEVCNRNPT
jgi:hypothetical protein